MAFLKFKVSSKIIAFFAVEWVSFILAAKTKIDIFFFIFISAALLLCVDLFFLLFSFFLGTKIVIVRKVQEKITEGETLALKLFIRNGGLLPLINVMIGDFLGCDSENSTREFFFDWLKPKGENVFEYSCLCRKRGKYDIGPVKIVFFGFVGFFSIEKTYGLKTNVYVYPWTFNIKRVLSLARGRLPWFGLETTSISGDDHEFFGVREYRSGDSIKRIHWLSTAKRNKLIVREFERISFYQVSLVFVLNRDDNIGLGKESVCEYMIKIAASLAKYFTEKNICLEILAHAGRMAYFPSNKGEGYLEELFRFFATVNAESEIRLDEFLHENSKLIFSDTTVFMLLTDKSIDSAAQILSLKSRNISVVALVLISSSFEQGAVTREEANALKEKVAKRLFAARAKVLLFSKGDNLESVFLRSQL